MGHDLQVWNRGVVVAYYAKGSTFLASWTDFVALLGSYLVMGICFPS